MDQDRRGTAGTSAVQYWGTASIRWKAAIPTPSVYRKRKRSKGADD
ncbi:hypothetical protein [Paenibacillus glufosinatiresistens]|nr:hypothetical protein [Paenibacillus sp. YX.27]